MAGLPTGVARFVEALELLGSRSERIQFLIEVADRFREVPERVAQRPFPTDHEVAHCESGAFVWAERDDEGISLHFAVENPQGISARALAVILGEGLAGTTLDEVLAVPQDLPLRIFGRELSMGKSMGLTSMVAMVHHQARRSLAENCSAG